jgi:mRNA interferase RelE/StbE
LSKYKIFETNQFINNLNHIQKGLQEKLKTKIRNYVYPQIGENPYFGPNIRKLTDYKPETWRYRLGEYRLFYEINEKEKIVYIISIDMRKDAY